MMASKTSMAIGDRICFFRTRKKWTQKKLGMLVGFPEKSAEVRIAQYESGSRTPKEDLIKRLAYYLDVDPLALTVPDIVTNLGLIHTLFALEDKRGFTIDEIDGQVVLKIDRSDPHKYFQDYYGIAKMLDAWQQEAAKLRAGEITREEYDSWRYHYPDYDTSQKWVEIPQTLT